MTFRNKLGQYAGNLKTQIKRVSIWFGLRALVVAFGVIVTSVVVVTTNSPIVIEIEVPVIEANDKVEEVEMDIVYQIRKCESQGFDEKDGPMVLDRNNEISIGLWQYQRDTVIHYYKVLYDEEITRQEAAMIALDEEKSAELTRDILFETENGWKNWLICSRKNNIEAQLEVIKKLK